MRTARACLAAALVLLAAAGCGAQFGGMGGMGGGKPDLPPAVRSDVPFIKCDACQRFVKQAARETRELRDKAGAKRLAEADIIEKLEQLCSPQRPEGEWMRMLDMVEARDRIELREMGQLGRHTTETSTIARACVDVSEALDLSDLSEALYKGKTRAQLVQLACYDMSSACSKKPPPVPKGRPAGPAFSPLSQQDADRERLMAQLAASGMGGQLYDTASLKQQMEGLQASADAGEFGEGVRLSEVEAGGGGSGDKGVGGGGSGVAARIREGLGAAGAAAARVREGLGAAGGAAAKLLKRLSGRLGGGGGGGGGGEL